MLTKKQQEMISERVGHLDEKQRYTLRLACAAFLEAHEKMLVASEHTEHTYGIRLSPDTARVAYKEALHADPKA